MFSLILGLLAFLAIGWEAFRLEQVGEVEIALVLLMVGWGAFLVRLENVPTSTSLFAAKPKNSVIRYGKYALVFLLLLFLPVPIPLGLKILLWLLFLVGFLIRLAVDFKPARAQRSLAILRREFDAVAHLARNGKKQAALKLCDELARRGDMSPATVNMVRGYLEESPAKSPGEMSVLVNPPTEVAVALSQEPTLDQLIATHRYGTAAEVLEREIMARPEDFDLFMKYLNLLARHGSNPRAADQALRDRIRRKAFSPEQLAAAGEQLQEIHRDLQLGDEGVTLLKDRKKPKRKETSELL